jgi:hypothetical protein
VSKERSTACSTQFTLRGGRERALQADFFILPRDNSFEDANSNVAAALNLTVK